MTLHLPAPWRALGCLALAATVHAAAPAPDSLRAGLALFALIGALWITQALHITLTALLVPLLATLAGLLDPREALAPFAHPVIFLFLGGFVLATALQQQGLDRALALAVLRAARGRRLPAALLLFALTAVLSMWISNTATAAMMLPLALGLLAGDDVDAIGPREQAFVLLGVAYAASIGGMATLVGSPPNAIAAAHVGIGFAAWFSMALPVVAVMLPAMTFVLWLVLRPRLDGRIDVVAQPLAWTRGRQLTVVVFALAATGWIGGASLGRWLGLKADVDSLVALAAAIALVAGGALDWRAAERGVQWGVLLLFGGGLALGQVVDASGAGAWLASATVGTLHGAPAWLLLAGVVGFVVFLSELVSNTAAAALMVPLVLGVDAPLGLPAPALAAAVALAASCGYMLPVATPPNALVYGTGRVEQASMMRCGLWLNMLGIAVITAAAAWWSR